MWRYFWTDEFPGTFMLKGVSVALAAFFAARAIFFFWLYFQTAGK